MNKSRLFLLLSILILAFALSSCAGGTGVSSSWPGLSISPDGSTGYLANGQFVYAVNMTNGTELWRFPEKASASTTFFAPPALAEDGKLYVGSYNNNLYSLTPGANTVQETGGKWPFKARNHYVAAPLVTDQGIFAPSADDTLYALDASGNLKWKFTAEHALWSTPATDGTNIYVASMDHSVYALNPDNGQVVWQSEDLGGAIVGKPTLSEDGKVMFVGTFGSAMTALDVATGKVLWRTPTAGWVWSGPALANGKLFFGDLTGKFYALNAADGAEVWSIQPDTLPKRAIPDRPLVVDETVYFGSETGTLYAVDAANGSPRWNQKLGDENTKLLTSPLLAGDLIVVAPLGTPELLFAFDKNGARVWAWTPEKK